PRLDQVEPRVAEGRHEVAFLHGPRVVIGEAIEARDKGSVLQQPIGQGRSDEPGHAGNQRLHASNWRTRSGSRQGRPRRSIDAWMVWPVARMTSPASSCWRTTSYTNF